MTQRIEQYDRQLFAAASLILVIVSATLAGLSPVWFSVAIVVAFGAPHNWAEFRYFLSRLPSRFGPFRPFFITAFAGALFLCMTEVALIFVVQENAVPTDFARKLLCGWNQMLIVWILVLYLLRYRQTSKDWLATGILLVALVTVSNCLAPQVFTMALLYVHPLVGLWIFERELRRTRKSWLKVYHGCLLAVPIAIVALAACLSSTAYDTVYTKSLTELSGNVGSDLFKGASPAVLLAVYGFLQMIHYGVWVLAMPIATRSWQRWRLDRLPALTNRLRLRAFVGSAVALGAVALIGFWIGFKFDYGATMNIYVLLSTLHVLAEAPFMLWMCES